MKNILYISYDGMTDPLGQSQVLPYLRGLSKNGYKISLISCEKPDRLQLYRQTIEKICKEANIDWYPFHYTKKPPLLSTIWDISKISRKANQLHKQHHFELVHCRSYISALVGMKLKRKHGIKMLFDMRGFWADERIDGNIWQLSNPVFKCAYNYFKKKEKDFFTHADHVVSLTENGKQEILSWNLPSVTTKKITVIPCCVDLELFNPNNISEDQQKEKKIELKLSSSDFILGYVGSIGTWYMLPEMLDYFTVLKEKKTHSKFLFVTGEKPENIYSVAQQKGISSSDIVVASCLHKDVSLYISLFNESIFFIRPTYSKKASSPTKQGEIMAMGVPLICNSGVGDTDLIVINYESGVVINDLNKQSYMEAVEKETVCNRSKTIQGASEYFSLETGVERYTKIYSDLL
jgi:glycosyltransferase involved in cell wall biosynthesis